MRWPDGGYAAHINTRRLIRDVRAQSNRERLRAQALRISSIEARALARLAVGASRRLRAQALDGRGRALQWRRPAP